MIDRKRPVRRRHGATVYELLIAMVVLTVFVAIGFVALGRLGRQVALEREATGFAQDLQFVRARAVATSSEWRLRVTADDGYAVERRAGADWSAQRQVVLDGYRFGNLMAGDSFGFDERGIGDFDISGDPATEVRMIAADGSGVRIVLSLTGAVRSVGL